MFLGERLSRSGISQFRSAEHLSQMADPVTRTKERSCRPVHPLPSLGSRSILRPPPPFPSVHLLYVPNRHGPVFFLWGSAPAAGASPLVRRLKRRGRRATATVVDSSVRMLDTSGHAIPLSIALPILAAGSEHDAQQGRGARRGSTRQRSRCGWSSVVMSSQAAAVPTNATRKSAG